MKITEDERLQHNIKWVTRNGVGIQVMETLAVGAFLTAFALQLGASNAFIGALAAIPHLSQLAQLPALTNRKRDKDDDKCVIRCDEDGKSNDQHHRPRNQTTDPVNEPPVSHLFNHV